ncbi:MAG TPA: YIP1 family protein [Candidatus Binataceae bacterium]|nr:YIP1 family protein [Candidatus Binataceae bacterium]
MGAEIAEWVVPFFAVWILPRSTIRRIVDSSPERLVVAIAWILGALIALTLEVQLNAGALPIAVPPWFLSIGPVTLAMTIFSSGVAAIGIVYFLGFVYVWAGRALGGIADLADVRSAIAWGWVPLILLTLVVMASAIFTPNASEWDKPATAIADRINVWNVVEVVIAIWSFVVSVQTLAEVHRLSASRALGAKAIGALALSLLGLSVFIVMTLMALILSAI